MPSYADSFYTFLYDEFMFEAWEYSLQSLLGLCGIYIYIYIVTRRIISHILPLLCFECMYIYIYLPYWLSFLSPGSLYLRWNECVNNLFKIFFEDIFGSSVLDSLCIRSIVKLYNPRLCPQSNHNNPNQSC